MPIFQQQDIIELVDGAARLRIAPQAGGRLLSWHIGDEPIIFWPEQADWSAPAKVRGGNPLLFPFLGRHRVGDTIGRWRDAAGVVRDLPMHGFARDLPFAAHVDADGRGVDMTLESSEATREAYPFAFRFDARYQFVDAYTLDVELTTRNLGDAPLPSLPYYAGHHFYFALPHDERARTRIELPPTRQCHQQPDGSISAPIAGEPHYTLDEARILDRFHCLEGVPSRPVQIDMAGRRRRIEIDLNRPGSIPWYAVTTWTEKPESDFYCVEPWLGLPDAIHNGLGLRMLAPGATETAALRIRVSPLG
ncbi:aldose epimerase [Burkholderia gladioli]|uniref:aldose epimerase family protein n=1 Tax=Burkholderia gladioli TaxID=28095 RepID=UPI00163E543B|nr:aldose epimerase [Burkholderia gladioli]